ncbi:MAG: hypothetical protein L0Y54_24220 [Sporichthyaceae bacterium]|nr:hypothetical protein [Sporichthyaceae bacterium]
MGGTGGPSHSRAARSWCAALLALVTPGCGVLPSELNLSPIYRHRLDRDGSVREMDVLWPIFHYRKNDDGGWELRVRPLYRHVSEGPAAAATEHQFLWPFGRVRQAEGETRSRLFPLWRYHARLNQEGKRETDWNVALLVWGGTSEDGTEDYFGVLPFYADLPDFLTYDRFRVILFPLYVGLEKGDQKSHQFLWPLIGFGGNQEGTVYWHRVLPLYGVSVDTERFERYTALWPFVHWGHEAIGTDDPISRFFLFPLVGWQSSEQVQAWTALWPLFQEIREGDRHYKLDVLWPIYRQRELHTESEDLEQWWVWPLVGHVESTTRDSWSFLWPVIWWRRHEDHAGVETHRAVLPLYWRVRRERPDGRADDFLKAWPFYHQTSEEDGSRDWQALSPWPWRSRYGEGVQELYGWIWTLAAGRHSADASSFELAGNLYTSSERDGRHQSSVPLLFNYESDETGSTLRLLQLIPIPWGAARAAPDED